MEAFIALESLLEYFVFSTADTQQHEDDLIAHSKVSKGEALASKGKYSPKFYASIHPATFSFIIFFFFCLFISPSSVMVVSYCSSVPNILPMSSHPTHVAGIPSQWRGSLRRL